MESAQSGAKSSNGFAVTALVLGIVAFCLGWTGAFGLVLSILALIFGILALVKKQSKGMGITGVVLGSVALVIALVFTLIGAALLGGAAQVANTVTSKQHALDSAQKDFAKGETAVFDNLTVKATTVTPNWQPADGLTTPFDGNQYVYVMLNIKNTSSDKVTVDPFNFKLVEDGVASDHYFATTPKPLNTVDINPGASVDGDLVFQAKKDATNLKLRYTASDPIALKEYTYTLGL